MKNANKRLWREEFKEEADTKSVINAKKKNALSAWKLQVDSASLF